MKLNVAEVSRPRSWADLVRGKENAVAVEPQKIHPEPTFSCSTVVRPAKRGEKSVLCRGKLLVMLGHYGWIAPKQTIDHPDVSRRAGRVYLARKDVRSGALLEAGTEVDFFLYVDADGLGAEDCRPVEEGFSKTAVRQRKWHPPALTHQVHATSSPGSVILVRPDAVQHWMDTSPAKTFQHHKQLCDSHQAVVSEASTSAGESGSESESLAKRICPKASRRTAVSMGPPPGLNDMQPVEAGAMRPPPGL